MTRPVSPAPGGRILVLTLAGLICATAASRAGDAPRLPPTPDTQATDTPYPINLPTALQLANAKPLDIALATQRVQAAAAQLARAEVLWLPTLYLGIDYARSDGQIQDIVGQVFTTSRSSIMAGVGPSVVFAVSDALYAPLAARQILRSREAEQQASINDSLLTVAEAYFTVQQARGDLAGTLDTVKRAEELLRRTEQLSGGLVPQVEVQRVRTELARRRLATESARERWQVASAELARLLRLSPAALVVPIERPELRIELIQTNPIVDDLIALALTTRPELASRQALVQATLARLKQEKIRPLVPSVLLRGNATNPGGTLSAGVFGGGVNDVLTNFNARHSVGVQVLWEVQNLGLGNRAAVRERQAESEQALLELFRTQDRVAAEVVQAHAQIQRTALRIPLAEEGLTNALETLEKNLQGLTQTRRVGEALVLVFRPQEVVAALQALENAYRDYYAAIAEHNRAQFRLYRALGHPAQMMVHPEAQPSPAPAASVTPARYQPTAHGSEFATSRTVSLSPPQKLPDGKTIPAIQIPRSAPRR